jgi:uncharacterized membrane protein YdjX (TVP38/TMEM64 family)
VSPSKKATKKNPPRKNESAQKSGRKASAASSRVETNISQQAVASPAAQPETQNKPRGSKLSTNILRALALVAVIAITVYIYSIRERVEEFRALGYWGGFLIALLANATVLLPAPGVAIISWMGSIFNPLGVGLAAGTGGTIGELSGYLAGFSGQAVIERTDVYNRMRPWVTRYGGWAILVLSAIPNPFFDIAGIAAGIAKMPLRTFLIFTWVGQCIKMTLFALAGYHSFSFITDFMK